MVTIMQTLTTDQTKIINQTLRGWGTEVWLVEGEAKDIRSVIEKSR